MSTKIQKWGNSLGVRIPKIIAEQAHLLENSEVEILHQDGKIVIFPSNKKHTLASLLKQINKNNLHDLQNEKREGNEEW